MYRRGKKIKICGEGGVGEGKLRSDLSLDLSRTGTSILPSPALPYWFLLLAPTPNPNPNPSSWFCSRFSASKDWLLVLLKQIRSSILIREAKVRWICIYLFIFVWIIDLILLLDDVCWLFLENPCLVYDEIWN